MLRDGHIRSKVYAICFGVLKNWKHVIFGLKDLKRKTRYVDVFKGWKQEISYRDGI